MWLLWSALLLGAWLGRPQPLPRDRGPAPTGDHYREYYQHEPNEETATMTTASPAAPLRLRRYGAQPKRLGGPEGALKDVLAGRLKVADSKKEATLMGRHATGAKLGPRRAFFLNRLSTINDDPKWATVKTIPVNTRATARRDADVAGSTKRHPSFIFTKFPTLEAAVPTRTPVTSLGLLEATAEAEPWRTLNIHSSDRSAGDGTPFQSRNSMMDDSMFTLQRFGATATATEVGAPPADRTFLFTTDIGYVELTTVSENPETHELEISSGTKRYPPEQTASLDRDALRERDMLIGRIDDEPTTADTTIPVLNTTTTTTTTTTPSTTLNLDLNALISIVADLAYNMDYDLVADEFNRTMIKYSVPTCSQPTTTTTTTTTTTPPPLMVFDANATVVAKCFMCGLESTQIPFNAHCGDAFAGDFIPVVPVDASAKHHISSYRKYCRYMDVSNYVQSPQLKRDVYGRWTGGCSVRWTDLSGVYTQRACRSKRRAVTGLHFASKRMAKLEMALRDVDSGCIVSPAASLLPLSRGVSLFARVHACVCMGSFCNGAPLARSVGAALALCLATLPF